VSQIRAAILGLDSPSNSRLGGDIRQARAL